MSVLDHQPIVGTYLQNRIGTIYLVTEHRPGAFLTTVIDVVTQQQSYFSFSPTSSLRSPVFAMVLCI